MRILLNGESVEVRDAENISQLIEQYRLLPQSVLIEHNGLALHRREWPQRFLSEGDRVELIRVVAGG